MLDDLLQHALEGLQVKAQLDTGTLPKKAPMQTSMKVSRLLLPGCCSSVTSLDDGTALAVAPSSCGNVHHREGGRRVYFLEQQSPVHVSPMAV